jgi:hypothetical protein
MLDRGQVGWDLIGALGVTEQLKRAPFSTIAFVYAHSDIFADGRHAATGALQDQELTEVVSTAGAMASMRPRLRPM